MVSTAVKGMTPQIRTYFKGQPVAKAWLFGSCSRGEETAESDVDILVRYKKSERITLFTISRMMCSLQKLLNRNVDLVEEECLLPFASDSVKRNQILIYEGENQG